MIKLAQYLCYLSLNPPSLTVEKKIPMTCPVITKITPSQGPACESTFAMNFFLEPEEGDAPQPTNTEVKLTELPKMKVYIRYWY